MEELLKVKAGPDLSSGIFPGLDGEAPLLWADCANVLFQSGKVRKSQGLLGLATPTARITGMKAAQKSGGAVLYLGYGGKYSQYTTGGGITELETGLSAGGVYTFAPVGEHVVVCNQQAADGLRYYDGTDAQITTPFTHAKGIFAWRNQVWAYNTSTAPNALETSDIDDFEDWTPDPLNSATLYTLRDIPGGLECAAPLGQAYALYSENSLSLIGYTGGTNPYSVRTNVVTGIGGCSPYAVVDVGNQNFGIMKARAWVTDGVTFQYIDDPWVREVLNSDVNWDRKTEVYGWHDRQNGSVRWVLPSGVSDFISLSFRIAQPAWTRHSDSVVAGEKPGIFDNAFLAKSARLLRADTAQFNNDGSALASSLQTKPLDFGNRQMRKLIDKVELDLVKTGTVLLDVGFSDTPEGAISWDQLGLTADSTVWMDQDGKTNREGVYIHMRLRTTATNVNWELGGFTISGEFTSYVN